jgi:hypothetical protein
VSKVAILVVAVQTKTWLWTCVFMLVALARGEDAAQVRVVHSRDAGDELHGNMQRGIVSLQTDRRLAQLDGATYVAFE